MSESIQNRVKFYLTNLNRFIKIESNRGKGADCMIFQESETVELKEVIVDDIKKEIIAFANCNGGKLYVGVRDDGTVAGLEDPDNAALQISNMVRDTIKPDITMFLHYETIYENEKKIVVVDIQRGTDRPYYIAKKGMRPEGVYVRQGDSSVPATDAAIRRMIKETDGDHFEAMRSLNQNLTFYATTEEFQLRNVEFGSQQMRSLKLIDSDGLYTNLALLLSDQCVHSIKAAVFQGKDQTIFKDRREFSGSLMKQMHEVYDFIDFRNQTRATVEKLLRVDVRDYPEIAIREALLNLLVHREYSFSASALISLYKDRIEFVSIGGLMPEIELEDILAGISICRNPDLANIFYRLQLIEAYGTGISKIMKAYEGTNTRPRIETTKNTFKIILPNVNINSGSTITSIPAKEEAPVFILNDNPALSSQEKRILEYARNYNQITKNNAASLLEVSASTATRLINGLLKQNLLVRHGKARNTYYTVKQ